MKRKTKLLLNETKVFERTSDSRFLPNVLVILLLFLCLMFIGEAIAFFFYGRIYRMLNITPNTLIKEAIIFSLNLIISFGTLAIIFFGWVRFIENRKIKTMGFIKGNILGKYLVGFMLGVAMMTVAVVILTLLGMIKIENISRGGQGVKAVLGITIVLIGWIIQGATEEIMIRGWLLPVIGTRHNIVLGIIISSTIFGVLHLANPNVSLLSFINLVLFGLFAALYVIWEGSLWGICGLHSAWNWAQGNIYGFEVSGTNAAGGVILNLKTVGSNSVTGGYFGPEGGVVISLILGLGILVLVSLIRRKNQRTYK